MNAPQQEIQSSTVSFDGHPELREDVYENMGGCAIYASLAQTFAERGDDGGLAYATRCAAAHLRAAIGSLNDLAKANEAARGGRP